MPHRVVAALAAEQSQGQRAAAGACAGLFGQIRAFDGDRFAGYRHRPRQAHLQCFAGERLEARPSAASAASFIGTRPAGTPSKSTCQKFDGTSVHCSLQSATEGGFELERIDVRKRALPRNLLLVGRQYADHFVRPRRGRCRRATIRRQPTELRRGCCPIRGATLESVVWIRHSSPKSNVRLILKYGAIGSGARLAAVRPAGRGLAFELQRTAAQVTILLAVRVPAFQVQRDAAGRRRERQFEAIDVRHRSRQLDRVNAFFERDRQLAGVVAGNHRGRSPSRASSGHHCAAVDGSGNATVSAALMSRRIVSVSADSFTLARSIAAHAGRHSGGFVRRRSSSPSRSALGMSAWAGAGDTDAGDAQQQRPRRARPCASQPRRQRGGRRARSRRLRLRAATTAAPVR